MKVAKIRYNGPMRSTHRKGPSGATYRLRRTETGATHTEWVPVYHAEDAAYFERNDTLEVEWSGLGKVYKEVGFPLHEMKEHVSGLSYRKKQEVAKALGVKANKKESKLEAAIVEASNQLIKETQH